MPRVSYRKGPLGYAVLLDGKPVGRIADRRNMRAGWQVSVPGLNAAQAIASRGPFQGATVFPKLAAAKVAVEAVLTAT